MDWFEKLTGFRETDYKSTQARLEVTGDWLKSLVNGKTYGIGRLELISLRELRDRVDAAGMIPGKLKVAVVQGDVRRMHQSPANAGALFQVASQFNLLEMVSPEITPEHGVTRYQNDHTQGPACAIAAGAATIYRNYFAPVGDQRGQSAQQQLDGLIDIGGELSRSLGRQQTFFWEMRNGYALCTKQGLNAIAECLGALDSKQLDDLRGKLLVGLHSDVEVTDAASDNRPRVSQAFCSALPVAYTRVSSSHWKAFATLVLEAAYEATLLAAVQNAQRGVSNRVLLTRLGGGAFGNHDDWIDAAMRRCLAIVRGVDLDVQIVSYGEPSQNILQIAKDFGSPVRLP